MQASTDHTQSPAAATSARLMSPEEIAAHAGDEAPFILYPEAPTVFADREARLRHLADNHAMRDYLFFAADVAAGQHAVLNDPAMQVTVPDEKTASQAVLEAIHASRPLLDVLHHQRDGVWLSMLRQILAGLQKRHAHRPAAAVISALLEKTDDEIDRMADRLLHGYLSGLDLAHAQLVAAGLQVYFTAKVIALQSAYGSKKPEPFGRIMGRTELCPCCSSRPVASITRISAQEAGLRYVSCSLCSSQWHVVRIKCVACENTAGIVYESLKQPDDAPAGDIRLKPAAVQAECCDACGHYLKIVHMEKDQFVEPHADDLASVALDLLVAEGGRVRFGNNLMLLFGQADNAPDDPGLKPPGDPGGH